MSIDFCRGCERTAMGEEDTELATEEDGTAYLACAYCGEEITSLPEDDPRRDR